MRTIRRVCSAIVKIAKLAIVGDCRDRATVDRWEMEVLEVEIWLACP